jgi:hypothetical protein
MLRNALSGVYTYFLRSPDHVGKERGVTAMVCTYNEEGWVDLSLSIKDLVREIIVVTPPPTERRKSLTNLNANTITYKAIQD